MSFKRDGDDQAWLNLLKKRRVSELFAVDIPDDEALLMKNGRFACLVCRHRPVFDTVATLAVHRSGKKHANDAEQFVANKKDLEELVLKRRHEQYMKSGERVSTNRNTSSNGSNSMVPDSGSHRLLSACVYDPCVKRRNVGPYGRRQVVNLGSSTTDEPNASCTSSSSTSSNAGQLSKRRWQLDEKPAQTIADIRKQMRRLESADNPAPLKPYIGKRSSDAEHVRIGPGRYVSADTSAIAGTGGVAVSVGCASRLADPKSAGISYQEPVRNVRRTSHNKINVCPTVVTDERKETIAKYFSAVGSGWKRSRDGSWIKDEEAEFDSDDEPPDSL